MSHGKAMGKGRRALVALGVVALSAAGGCSEDGGGDLSPAESEVGEEDTEIVPGEEGPVD